MKKKNIDYELSSGNVFADLGLPNPEEMLAKADLASQINDIIKKRKLTQVKAAKLLEVDQPKISLLAQGKLSGFSLERLFRFLNILGQDITIKVTKATLKKKTSVNVSFPRAKKSPIIKRPNISSNSAAVHAKKKK
jgi:predicted XRE-type DNA-binding protein